MHEIHTEIAVIGGGTGGVAAALAALGQGRRVILTEETDWIGGQLTSQLVPPDEHRWIERFGCTQSYRQLRDDIREFYRRWFPLSPADASCRVEHRRSRRRARGILFGAQVGAARRLRERGITQRVPVAS